MHDETERLELPGGEWIHLATRVTFGIQRRCQAAFTRRQGDDPDAAAQATGDVVLAFAQAWSFALDGEPVPLTREGIDRVDAIAVDLAFARCAVLYAKGTAGLDPKAGGRSTPTRSARPSRSKIRT